MLRLELETSKLVNGYSTTLHDPRRTQGLPRTFSKFKVVSKVKTKVHYRNAGRLEK